MGGGLMQLVAYGAQDIYLTGNPQITFFKVVYRRHTNFSMEAIQQSFSGEITNAASSVTATISRNGDLVHKMWLDIKMSTAPTGGTNYTNWTNNTGHAFIKDCEIEIGGQRIDRHYSQWLDVWNELTDHEESEWQGLNKHAAKNTYLKSNANTAPNNLQLYVPLQFWFCRNPGLALPLIALQYHEVKVKLTTRALTSLVNSDNTSTGGGAPTTSTLYCDYIYLDTDERRRFAQVSHEYLIEQVQRDTSVMEATRSLNFNHPVKALIWVSQNTTVATEGTTGIDATANADGSGMSNKNDYFNYQSSNSNNTEVIKTVTTNEHFATMTLKLNGHERFKERNATYFRICQPQQHGFKVPSKHIYCYSFALKPTEHQPSGTCNFSRIDNAQMDFKGHSNGYSDSTLTVYAINYNVLRIMSGMGGLAYSN
uniref:Major capsid protein N-terminal domain-containing protein n=1 Tax=viral metagenome TaxID=1070528 RepID=A0A6C0C478_9ZZZZ